MSVIGSNCLVLTSGQLHPVIIRAASQPAYRTSDFSQIKVLLEWGEGETLQREWVDLSKGDKFQAVYVEQGLLWAKRILSSEQHRAVAWPSKAFTLLCSSVPHIPDTVVVEYFCDKERAELYLPETKELVLSEAKLTLVQHPQMLQELTEWEERMRSKELLVSGSSLLTGCRVSFCSVQQMGSWISGVITAHNLQTKEVTVLEDGGDTHIVNPLMEHLVLVGEEGPPQPSARRASQLQCLLDTSNNSHQQTRQQQQRMWLQHAQPPSTTAPNLTPESLPPISSPTALNSPHPLSSPHPLTSPHPLSSPILHECQSPHFNLNGHNPGRKSFAIYRTPSVDLQRSSGLQQISASLMRSEPNLSRSSLDTLGMQQCSKSLFDIQDSSRAPLHVQSSSTNMARGSASQLSGVGSNSTLSDFPEADAFFRQERSKSLDNINIFGMPQSAQLLNKRRSSLVSSRNAVKKPRFDILPALQEKGVAPPNRSLSRSASQPDIFPKLKGKLAIKFPAALHSASGSHQRDELDMIQQIINEDRSLDDGVVSRQIRSVSLSHIPGYFSSTSLPSLARNDSINVLHCNYNSTPDFSLIRSPPNYEISTAVQKTTPPMATLTHESRSSSMSDFAGEQATDPATPFSERRNSGFELHGLPTPAQSTPSACGMNFDLQGGMFDFNNHRRGSAQSTQSSSCYSDAENRTPGFDDGRRGSAHSGNILDVAESFQFPNPTSSSCDSQHSETNLGSSSSAPLSKLLSSSSVSAKPTEHMPLLSEHSISSPTLIAKVENPTANQSCSSTEPFHSSHIVSEVEFLSPLVEQNESEMHVVDTMPDQGEFAISRVINPHLSDEGSEEGIDVIGDSESEEALPLLQPLDSHGLISPLGSLEGGSSSDNKKKTKKKTQQEKPGQPRRGRGRPRLSEEEKQRRKELRELGLMKRSKRRTKEQVAQWRAEKILTPAKRGRKPGSGKKNIIKAATGKVVFVTVDLSQYQNGTVLLQNGFCRAFPGVSKCMECSACEGDLPVTRYCRFLEFRKLCVLDNSTPVISVEGFADYTDVSVEDLVPWTPLKTGYSGMDESSALLVLSRVMPHFIAIVSEEAKTLPVEDVIPVWKQSVKGVRELCDTCETTLFNFHWVCRNCGFCVCPICHQHACDSNDGSEVSSMQPPWPACPFSSQPHRTPMLILAQIIPANVLAEVVSQALRICEARNIELNVPPLIHRLVHALGRMEPVSRFQNEAKKNKGGAKGKKPQTPLLQQLPHHLMDVSCFPSSSMNPALPPISDLPTLELPHSCSNGTEEGLVPAPVEAPHLWLCSDTLLCLLDPRHEKNIVAFQERWKRGQPVLVSGIHHHLDRQLWTPEAFERDFGNEPADLVDCRMGLVVLQVPCRTFWAGFDNMEARLRDPTSDEPRLLKLKDWPPVDDFSEKLPKRFADLMNALPLPEYTLRDAKLNMAASLPDFFVKPDLGPKMYNAYGSAAYPKFGTTNLHLDISDAVNVMVYCSTPPSVRTVEKRLVEETIARECCPETSRRVKNGEAVGALWHLYAASDTDKIRGLLRKVFEERGLRQPTGSDPIHDQLIYLDSELRQRLYAEYGVKGWTIAQFVGDAIFIPAGAAHQVRNLSSCIKVAEDFVSPEHVYECLKLTEEFRQLSDRHANHEDKLQMKNIIYHSMKDIVGILKSSVK